MTSGWSDNLVQASRMLDAPALRPALEGDLAKLPPAGGDPRLFFINAHPRSGTNWLGCIMNLHPAIACTGEFTFHDVFNGVQAFVNGPGRAARREPVRTAALHAFQRFVHDTMASLAATKENVLWVGDHTPRRVRFLVPGAAHIVLFRDGRDVLVSWTFNALARKEHWVVPAEIKPLFESEVARFSRGTEAQQEAGAAMLESEVWVRHVARQWASQVRDDLDAVARMNGGEFPGRITMVRYEDLHADIERERARLYRFLDLDAGDAPPVSDQTRTSTTFITTEDPASHYRRGRVGDWEERLSHRAVRCVEDEAGNELNCLGYEIEGHAGCDAARRPVYMNL
jgi:hypothetical protein